MGDTKRGMGVEFPSRYAQRHRLRAGVASSSHLFGKIVSKYILDTKGSVPGI